MKSRNEMGKKVLFWSIQKMKMNSLHAIMNVIYETTTLDETLKWNMRK